MSNPALNGHSAATQTLLQAALDYHQQGFCVVPLYPLHHDADDTPICSCAAGARCTAGFGKHPWVTWGENVRTATSEQEVVSWWAERPTSGIGCLTGRRSGIVVVEYDPRAGGSREAVAALGLPLDTLTVRSGGGGEHFYYRYPPGVERVRSVDLGLPGVELKADGRLVVMPPTLHRGGRHYEWVHAGAAMQDFPFDTFSEALRGRLTAQANRPTLLNAVTDRPETDTPLQRHQMHEWVERALRVLEDGHDGRGNRIAGRDDTLAKWLIPQLRDDTPPYSLPGIFDACCAFLGQCRERGLGADDPLSEEVVWGKIERLVVESGKREPGIERDLRLHWLDGSAARETPGEGRQREAGQPPRFVIHPAADLRHLPKPQWLVRQVLLTNGLSFIGGDSGTGKTTVATDLALCVAHGLPWRGHDVRPGPVVYIAGEDVPGLALRVVAWQLAHGVEDSPAFYWLDVAPQIIDRREVEHFIAAIEALELDRTPALIVLDTLATSLIGVDENPAKETGAAMDAVKLVPQRFGCQMVMLHHTPKSGSGLRGSGVFRASADTVFEITKDTDSDVLLVNCTKQRNGASPFKPFNLRMRPVELDATLDTEDLTAPVVEALDDEALHVPVKKAAGRPAKVVPNDVLLVLQGPMTRLAWERAATEQLGISSATFERCRARLVEERLVTRDEETKMYTALHLTMKGGSGC